jgi:hypothetical protein
MSFVEILSLFGKIQNQDYLCSESITFRIGNIRADILAAILKFFKA